MTHPPPSLPRTLPTTYNKVWILQVSPFRCALFHAKRRDFPLHLSHIHVGIRRDREREGNGNILSRPPPRSALDLGFRLSARAAPLPRWGPAMTGEAFFPPSILLLPPSAQGHWVPKLWAAQRSAEEGGGGLTHLGRAAIYVEGGKGERMGTKQREREEGLESAEQSLICVLIIV